MLVPLRKAMKMTGLSANTLRKYADNGTIRASRIGNGQRLFDTSSFHQGWEEREEGKPIVCYCRVSSGKQRDDLARQVVFMRERFPGAEIIKDIGSGLNFKRKGLDSILRRLMQGDKFTLIVAHRDRLCRFGFDLIESMFDKNGGEIMVLDKSELSPQRELVEDLLSIIHVFSCRLHGLRRYESKIKDDKNLSDEGAEEPVQSMVRGIKESV